MRKSPGQPHLTSPLLCAATVSASLVLFAAPHVLSQEAGAQLFASSVPRSVLPPPVACCVASGASRLPRVHGRPPAPLRLRSHPIHGKDHLATAYARTQAAHPHAAGRPLQGQPVQRLQRVKGAAPVCCARPSRRSFVTQCCVRLFLIRERPEGASANRWQVPVSRPANRCWFATNLRLF